MCRQDACTTVWFLLPRMRRFGYAIYSIVFLQREQDVVSRLFSIEGRILPLNFLEIVLINLHKYSLNRKPPHNLYKLVEAMVRVFQKFATYLILWCSILTKSINIFITIDIRINFSLISLFSQNLSMLFYLLVAFWCPTE